MPIHRLPNDVLAEIFNWGFHVAPKQLRSHECHLYEVPVDFLISAVGKDGFTLLVSSVCRRWRRVVWGMWNLFTLQAIFHGHPVYDTQVIKSYLDLMEAFPGCDLEIIITHKTRSTTPPNRRSLLTPSDTTSSLEDVLAMIAHTVDRWIVLHIYFDSVATQEICMDWLSSLEEAGRLVQLIFKNLFLAQPYVLALHKFNDAVPNLEEVYLGFILLHRPAILDMNAENLSELTIDNQGDFSMGLQRFERPHATLGEMRGLLFACPRLRRLNLFDVFPRVPNSEVFSIPRNAMIPMNHLVELVIDDQLNVLLWFMANVLMLDLHEAELGYCEDPDLDDNTLCSILYEDWNPIPLPNLLILRLDLLWEELICLLGNLEVPNLTMLQIEHEHERRTDPLDSEDGLIEMPSLKRLYLDGYVHDLYLLVSRLETESLTHLAVRVPTKYRVREWPVESHLVDEICSDDALTQSLRYLRIQKLMITEGKCVEAFRNLPNLILLWIDIDEMPTVATYFMDALLPDSGGHDLPLPSLHHVVLTCSDPALAAEPMTTFCHSNRARFRAGARLQSFSHTFIVDDALKDELSAYINEVRYLDKEGLEERSFLGCDSWAGPL